MGAGVFRRDALTLYPLEILPGKVGDIPLPGQLASLAARNIVKAAAFQNVLRCLLLWGRLGIHEKRAAVEYQLGWLELVIERLLLTVGCAPVLANLGKGGFEVSAE